MLIHPPAVYDFREKPLFPGPMVPLGRTAEYAQFTRVAIGVLSIADYLDRHGYKVIIDNLGDRMVNSNDFDVEEHIKNSSARIYAIGLHWHPHSQGAIEIAKICKKFHPESLVILGGLTATYFHEEIIRKYKFIDAVIRGEAEKPFLELMKALDKHGKLTTTPNLTYRIENGEICVSPLMKPSDNLDEFEFTRFDLLEPKTSVFNLYSGKPRWNLLICRGCIYNCIMCGGSAHNYKTNFGMEKPSFRSPGKIVEDIRRLNEQGVRLIGLFQDPRMGGEKYWKELFIALGTEKLEIERLSIDIFTPVDEEFVREIANIGKPVILYICPDAGACDVRKKIEKARGYSNEDLLETIKLCYKYHVPVQVFFSVGFPGETEEVNNEMWDLWDKLCSLEKAALINGDLGDIQRTVAMGGPILGPILVDPGAIAFDFPEKYGYKLTYSNLEEYIKGLSMPSWHQWLNFETNLLNKEALTELILKSFEYSIEKRKKFGIYDDKKATSERFEIKAGRMAVNEVDRIMNLDDPIERESRLKTLREAISSVLGSSSDIQDLYGYRDMIEELYFESMDSREMYLSLCFGEQTLE